MVQVAKGVGMGDFSVVLPGPVLFPGVKSIELMLLVGEAVEKRVLPQFRLVVLASQTSKQTTSGTRPTHHKQRKVQKETIAR